MNDLLEQIILAARNNDVESWMNILFVVVLAVLWAIGGIVKAKTKKAETQDGERTPRQPARGTPARSTGTQEQLLKRLQRSVGQPERRQYRPVVQQPRKRVVARQPVVQKLAAEAEQSGQLQTKKPPVGPKLTISVPQAKPVFEELPELDAEVQKLPEFTIESFEELEDKQIHVSTEMPESKQLAEILSDYDDPEELRRAILHYEILGRPLSLRDPS